MTQRQRRVLDFIIEFTNVKRYSPSYSEIAEGLGYRSLATVFKHVNALDGIYLDRQYNQVRALEVRPQYLKEHGNVKASASRRPCPTCNGTGRVSEVSA